MDPLAWAGCVLLVGLTLTILEVFIPSGGMLGFLAIVSVLTSIGLAFRQGPWYGLGFLGIAVVAMPVVLATALRYWPNTPMGRRFLLKIPTSDEVLPDDEDRRSLKNLVGHLGQARCAMLPGGIVEIQGRALDAVSEGAAIDPGQWVRIVEVHGTRVVVRPADAPSSADANDILSRPIDSVGLNPFEDPLE